jgi:hypothetical protein
LPLIFLVSQAPGGIFLAVSKLLAISKTTGKIIKPVNQERTYILATVTFFEKEGRYFHEWKQWYFTRNRVKSSTSKQVLRFCYVFIAMNERDLIH